MYAEEEIMLKYAREYILFLLGLNEKRDWISGLFTGKFLGLVNIVTILFWYLEDLKSFHRLNWMRMYMKSLDIYLKNKTRSNICIIIKLIFQL